MIAGDFWVRVPGSSVFDPKSEGLRQVGGTRKTTLYRRLHDSLANLVVHNRSVLRRDAQIDLFRDQLRKCSLKPDRNFISSACMKFRGTADLPGKRDRLG